MSSNVKQSKTYNIRSMVFPSKRIFYLIEQFDRILAPLFKIKKGPFCDEGLPNKKFRKNEDDYVKVLFELNKIMYKLDKRGPIYFKHTKDSGFQEAFPNIMHLFYERNDVFGWRPDEEVEESLSYEDSYLYYLSERLWNLGVYPFEF